MASRTPFPPASHERGRIVAQRVAVQRAERITGRERTCRGRDRSTGIPPLTGRVFALAPLVAIGLVGVAAAPAAQVNETTLEQMPAELETRFALSALPPALRDRASVHLLDPGKGYRLSRQGTSGLTCIVERTAWELADFRTDIYIPVCYDAVGTATYLKAIMDAAALRAQGMSPAALACPTWSHRSCAR